MSKPKDSANERDEALGAALGRIPSGIFVCSCGTGDASHPFIASWVMQASFDPPAVSVAIEDGRESLAALDASEGRFTLSMLPTDGHALMKPFFGGDESAPFGDLSTSDAPQGGRYLEDAVGWLECKEIERVRVGAHIIVMGRVLHGDLLGGDDAKTREPLVHIRKHGYSY